MTDRPHCQHPGACVAKTPGKHCQPCASATPECRARKAAGIRSAMQDPDVLARKQAAARRCSTDPEIVARRTATMLATAGTPEARERHRAACAAGAAKRLADPVKREQLREIGRTVGLVNLKQTKEPEALARRGATIRAKHLAWCPPEHWDRNKTLKRQGHLLPARQRIIAAEIEQKSLARHDHELAAHHLRRIAPIVRCDEAGKPTPAGSHWRYGSTVKTRTDVIRLALAKGWQPEALSL